MSTFDVDAFLQTTYKDANDTKLVPIPEGEYMAQIDKVEVKNIQKKDGSGTVTIAELSWVVTDQAAKDATGLATPRARQSIFLDVTEQGSLDMGKGKNVSLGKLRDAVGQNKPGKSWSFSHLSQATAFVKVEHEPNDKDPEIIYNRVRSVAAKKAA